MSKLLVLCEGSNELKIIELLLEFNKCIFTREDLVGLVPYHARQLSSPVIVSALNTYQGNFDIYRIGDKQNDELKIPKEYRRRIGYIRKYCTKPELEILLIINEKLYGQYSKSERIKPKEFAKKNIAYQRRRYDNSSNFYEHYYGGNEGVEKLIDNMREYKRLKKHNDDELYLIDLIKSPKVS